MAVSSTEADLVFAGGKIRTPAHPSGFAQALAIRDGVVAAVGSDDPAAGRIERDPAGRPTGALHDGAMRLVAAHVPPASDAELLAGLVAGQSHLHSLGITSFQDACVGAAAELGMPDSFGTYQM